MLKAGLKMRDVYLTYDLGDNGGRRIGIERRHFSYTDHIPERRCGVDRRGRRDRRSGADRRRVVDRRSATDVDRLVSSDRRIVVDRRKAVAP